MSTTLAAAAKHRATSLEIIHDIRDLWDLGDILVKSRMIPSSIGTPEAAVAIILKGRELGIGAMAAFAGITVIQGKPVVSPQLMLSLINRSGLMEDMKIEDDGQCCRVTMKRHGRQPHTASFSMDDARAMQLAGKDNWKKMPGIMRQWRAVAGCSRIAFPDVIDGMYTPEEMGADVNEEGEIVIDGEVIEPEPPPRKLTEGLHTKDHKLKTVEFVQWLGAKVAKVNEKWQDEWADDLVRKQSEGHPVPDRVGDLVTTIQIKGHLLKWAVAAEWLDPAIVPEDVKPINCEAYVARVFDDPEGKKAILAELGDYLQKCKRDKTAAFYRKHPHLASEEFAADQAEAARVDRGDAYEEAEPALSAAEGGAS